MSSKEEMECYNSGRQDGNRARPDYVQEDLDCALEDLSYWVAKNLDKVPMIFRNDQIQNKFYTLVKEFSDEQN